MSSNDRKAADAAAGAGEASANPFPTVAIGASAGGVAALQELFECLPNDLEAAFVVVVHLDPAHESELPSILSLRTKMPVTQVAGATPLEPRRVYIIPPNRELLVTDRSLALAPFNEPRWRRAPIDFFFRSLAAQQGDDFAIVLSGAGSDGALGVKAMKEAGGIIIVQDPEDAEYASMPRSAIETGLADFVLPIRAIAEKLPDLIRDRPRLQVDGRNPDDGEAMAAILAQLRVQTGHDFSNYKKSTVRRRIDRRMQVQRAGTMAEYLKVLRENAAEAQALFADLLISVTTFFRDPAAFDKLAAAVIPTLFEGKGATDVVRAWVPGCATGEEAYSIAMLLLEEMARRDVHCDVQVFASDIDDAALMVGREGRYPRAIEADVSDERLKRFFTRENDHHRVARELRDKVVFARHSLLRDPPFSRADLISCRNVLIYLDRDLQQQVCAIFHFALTAAGYLFLGTSESADTPQGLFRPIDRDSRIYQRHAVAADRRATPRIGPPSFGVEPAPRRTYPSPRGDSEAATHREALESLAPPSAIVDESYRVMHLSQQAGRYLQPSAGTLVNDITELAREELRFDLRAALVRAFGRGEPSLSGPIAVRFNGSARRVYLHAKPLAGVPPAARAAIVFFFEGEALGDFATGVAGMEELSLGERLLRAHQELQFTQAQLRTSREEYEEANEDLRAANEELQSINEEHRSTAEELETSKEELQSINEELQTANSELKSKLDSVSRAHSDIQNLMAATDVGILFLDPQLRINRFTPSIARLFNIVEGDEGRSITDFTHGLEYDGLADEARRIMRDGAPSEREVRSRSGAWYLMRLRPYRTVEDKADGVVVTFVDIGERRRAEDALRNSEARMRAVIDGVGDAIVTTDESGTVQSANAATTAMFGYDAEELVGRDVNMLAAESRPESHSGRFFDTGKAGSVGSSRELEGRRKDGSQFPIELSVSEIRHDEERLFIGFIRDLSERRRFEARLNKLHANRLDSMADMATALAHELNQPLAAASNYFSLVRQLAADPAQPQKPALKEAIDKAAAQLLRAGQIIAHLREFMARGEPNRVEQSLHGLIRRACDLATPSARERQVEIALALEAAEDDVLADTVHIEQALLNLMRNAMEAMDYAKERKLTITTALQDGMIRTEVADTGHGLPEKANAELFTPFTSTKATGLGVGLSISRSIVEAHYGSIWAEANPGGGAKFCFTLPLARLEQDQLAQSGQAQPAGFGPG
ncbi:two-component system CheB/CheR fusion protein [Roseiarcus fermentans]|uniref:Two-component system CheB/CheR fusion protein n=1 Tax=Roseiarcus fermentans TaxID=1473586 RepID=A0A366F7E4_9HYPH|nr:chemotaxis protein CheB [Roseiarcus fermentans]RBP09679.1 two-component system CheB/CheR fusion protein [Roseiarcus fermentans]